MYVLLNLLQKRLEKQPEFCVILFVQATRMDFEHVYFMFDDL